MEDGLLSLKWNNHKITFFEILRVLREKANYTDATIAVEGKFYPVHKLVMSTCSEYFSEIFERTPCKSPVIVLKDVRSQDMDALLDYMYLGEVNVNQNDLASLLKTAECLRIKGLAVPDEDPTKFRKGQSDDRRESPPPKRRRHEDSSSQPLSQRPVSPTISASSKTTPPSRTPPLQHQTSSLPVSQSQDSVHDSIVDPPPMVKVEMEEADDPDDGYSRRDNSYDGGSVNEGDGDFGTELSKSEHDPDNYGSGSFPGPSIQPGGDLPWDEGDSSSFPPEGFSGDLPAGQQPQGNLPEVPSHQQRETVSTPLCVKFDSLDLETTNKVHCLQRCLSFTVTAVMITITSHLHPEEDEGELAGSGGDGVHVPLTTMASSLDNPNGPPLLTPISQARQCQLCLVTLANANLLRRHVEDHHFHIRKYDCVHCGKKFKRKEHRERHERIHTGEKPFVCHICNARFTQKEHLKGHIENVHLKHGEKGLEGLLDFEREMDDQDDREDEDVDILSPASPPPTSTSPSLAPISSLLSLASSASPLTSILPTPSLLSSSASIIATTSSSLAPTITTTSSSPITSALIPTSLASDLNMNQFTALYAPVTRKTVNSPNKHMQTITINFN
nr:zinc finger and BTB domain-containing protein 46-like isoform X1 [Cherax quadricarinatus]XP_053637683.1 zinc finger and BTB domain-containing protein 46-like isoform X1 [Cherax quadricarinatus]XP_053637684.1 zinc finger and BTB domain-containing protein 46-like isoform X1 [Cherax quadricarinatus]XP_053637685.1 zinc finger and BTB domain-containing protein 46-like isoform X1 [Cherax quadricarinatus]